MKKVHVKIVTLTDCIKFPQLVSQREMKDHPNILSTYMEHGVSQSSSHIKVSKLLNVHSKNMSHNTQKESLTSIGIAEVSERLCKCLHIQNIGSEDASGLDEPLRMCI